MDPVHLENLEIGEFDQCLAPPQRAKRERPKKNRIQRDSQRKKELRHCSICGDISHNRRQCQEEPGARAQEQGIEKPLNDSSSSAFSSSASSSASSSEDSSSEDSSSEDSSSEDPAASSVLSPAASSVLPPAASSVLPPAAFSVLPSTASSVPSSVASFTSGDESSEIMALEGPSTTSRPQSPAQSAIDKERSIIDKDEEEEMRLSAKLVIEKDPDEAHLLHMLEDFPTDKKWLASLKTH
ncbi:hypothetical protein MMC08_001793 [Hypocenomyce scalaris]|nr:hypothetical protein [Hypocenomyce scalaris]